MNNNNNKKVNHSILDELMLNERGQLGLPNLGGFFRRPAFSSNVEGGLGNPQGYNNSAGRKDTTRADYFTSNNTTAVSTSFTELGSLRVLAQQALRFGFSVSGNNDNQGLFYFFPKTPNATSLATAPTGMYVRLVAKDANKFSTNVVKEFRSETTGGSLTDKTLQIFLPEQPSGPVRAGRNFVVQDEYLAIDIKPDASITAGQGAEISTTTTVIALSTTQYYL